VSRVILVVVIILALLLAIFGAQNYQRVDITFTNMTIHAVPLYAVMLVSVLVGILLATIIGARSRISGRLQRRKLEKQIADLNQQLAKSPAALVTDVPDKTVPIDTSSRQQQQQR